MSNQQGIIWGAYNRYKTALSGGQYLNPLSPGTRVTVLGAYDGLLEIQTDTQSESCFTKSMNVYLIPGEETPPRNCENLVKSDP